MREFSKTKRTQTMSAKIEVSKDRLADFCRRWGIRKLCLFGLVLRDDFSAASDVDVLVEFEPAAVAGYLEMAQMELELHDLFGRKTEVRTAAELSPYFRQQVLAGAETQYVSG